MPKKQPKFIYRTTNVKDDCFRVAIANILQIEPRKVPNFVAKYNDNYCLEAKKWLNKYNKTMTFVPFSAFLETAACKYNGGNIFPDGYCIVILKKNPDNLHVEVAFNGKILSNPPDITPEYDAIMGYFIDYDLILK